MNVLLQVDWLQQFLGSPDSKLSKAVVWAGIQAVPSRAAPMEAVLRSKCILLLAVTMKRRAVRLTSIASKTGSFPGFGTLPYPQYPWVVLCVLASWLSDSC